MSFGSFGSGRNDSSGFGTTTSNNPYGGFTSGTSNNGANSFGTVSNPHAQLGGGLFNSTGANQQVGNVGQVSNFPFMQPTRTNNDFEVPRDSNSPSDSISALKFSPAAGQNLLLVSSWDHKVRCYDIKGNIQHTGEMANLSSELIAFIEHPAPVLDVCFAADGTGCFSGGCCNTVRMWKFEATRGMQQSVEIGRHDAPVKAVGFIPERNMLVSAGWDRMLKYWDLRSPNPVLSVQLPGRADCMAVGGNYCIVGTGGTEDERQVCFFIDI